MLHAPVSRSRGPSLSERRKAEAPPSPQETEELSWANDEVEMVAQPALEAVLCDDPVFYAQLDTMDEQGEQAQKGKGGAEERPWREGPRKRVRVHALATLCVRVAAPGLTLVADSELENASQAAGKALASRL